MKERSEKIKPIELDLGNASERTAVILTKGPSVKWGAFFSYVNPQTSSMVHQIKNNRGNLPRLFWNNPLDRFFANDGSELWKDEMLPTLPSVKVKETDQYYSIEITASGLNKDDFNVELEGNFLTISCEKEEQKDSKDRFSQMEYNYTSFSRSFTLPENADVENVSAKREDGLLVIRINKKPESKSKNGHN